MEALDSETRVTGAALTKEPGRHLNRPDFGLCYGPKTLTFSPLLRCWTKQLETCVHAPLLKLLRDPLQRHRRLRSQSAGDLNLLWIPLAKGSAGDVNDLLYRKSTSATEGQEERSQYKLF